MTLAEQRDAILNDDAFVLEECRRLQTLFELKRVIRFHQTREEEIDTESVAEHVYGMHALATYFLPLEDIDNAWDRELVTVMMQFHDIDEIITGDTIGYMKTAAQTADEHDAREAVVAQLPESIRLQVSKALAVYNEQATPEARFAKAIDKIEPAFHLFNENGRRIFALHQQTHAQHRSIKDRYVASFPYIRRFNEVIAAALVAGGYFVEET